MNHPDVDLCPICGGHAYWVEAQAYCDACEHSWDTYGVHRAAWQTDRALWCWLWEQDDTIAHVAEIVQRWFGV